MTTAQEFLKEKGISTGCVCGFDSVVDLLAEHEQRITEQFVAAMKDDTTLPDNVNHPAHYTSHPSGVECIDITRHYDFAIGNAIKYLWRNGLKADANRPATDKQIEDLQKAQWYINDKLERLTNIKRNK